MGDAVTRAGALEDIYAAALDGLQRTLGADRASVLLFDDDDVMRFRAWRGLSDEYRRAVEGHSPWKRDESDPQPLLIADVLADPDLTALRPVFEREGIRSIGFIPLTYARRLLGKFMIYFDAPHVVSPPELQLAQTIASHIALGITRKRAETALRDSEQAHRLLAEAGALLNSSLDHAETLRSITRLVVPAIADWCLIDLTDDNGGFERIAAASAHADDEQLARRLRRRYGPLPDAVHGVSHAMQTGRAELTTEVDDALLASVARDAEHLEMLRAMRISSYVCVPLVTRGRTLGAITFVVGRSGRRYSSSDLRLAEELARRAAHAVDNARLYREAQEANRAKSQFLARMSHELRTPLNAIGGYAELLQMGIRGPVTDVQREDLARIERSQKHLLGLINDLLSFARIETGHVEMRMDSVSLDDALAGVEPLVEPQLTAKGLRYRRGNGGGEVICRADPDKLRQVLVNLLSNAVKFTAAGGEVAVEWDVTATTVDIHVRDSGRGIPADRLEVIFQPFVQLASGLSDGAQGTGLGLAISRELARAMGGEVTATSELGRGSTFTLALQRA
jgi:signal transduction histidine kinase